MAKSLSLDNTLCQCGRGQTGTLRYCTPLQRGIWQFLNRLHICLHFDPIVLLRRIYSEDVSSQYEIYMHKITHCNIIHDCKILKIS